METDPLRARTGFVVDRYSGLDLQIQKISDWIVGSLVSGAPYSKFENIGLLRRDRDRFDNPVTPIAQYSNVFLTYIGLLDPPRNTVPSPSGEGEILRVGFDLVMQPREAIAR